MKIKYFNELENDWSLIYCSVTIVLQQPDDLSSYTEFSLKWVNLCFGCRCVLFIKCETAFSSSQEAERQHRPQRDPDQPNFPPQHRNQQHSSGVQEATEQPKGETHGSARRWRWWWWRLAGYIYAVPKYLNRWSKRRCHYGWLACLSICSIRVNRAH